MTRSVDTAAAMNLIQMTSMVHAILANGLLAVGDRLTVEDNLLDAGLDSMAVAQLLLEIEERTGIWLDESLLTPENLVSCETLGRCVHGAVAAKRDRA